ncbi:MAG: murein biosynthesis integral membrane protein MurJ [Spirochaetota bacterium]
MKKKIFRSVSVIAAATLLSRILGFVRDMLIARYFGTGRVLDGFFVAFRIPNLFRRLVAEGSLTISFVPVYTEYLHLHGKEDALRFAQKSLTLLIIVLFAITGAGMVFSPALVSLFGVGFTDEFLISKTVMLNRIMFPYLFFIGIVAFCMGFLHSGRHFFAPAFSPVLLNVGFIAGAIFLKDFFAFELTGLAVGVVVGGLLQLLLQIPYMLRHGFVLRWSFDLNHPGIRKMVAMVGAAMAGGAVYQLNLLVNTMLASMLPGGSISYLYYSDRLTEMVMGIFIISIGNVMLPELSTFAAKNDIVSLKRAFRDSISASLFFALPAACGLILCGREILTVLFMRGAFDEVSVTNTYRALVYASAGLAFLAMYKMCTQIFYSLKDTRTPVFTAAASFTVNAALGYTLMQTPLLHAGLALSNAVAMGLQVILLLVLLRGKIGLLGFRRLVVPVIRIAAAAAVMSASLYGLKQHLRFEDVPFAVQAVNLLLLVGGGGAAYVVTALLLGVREMRVFSVFLRRAG